jgi:hypothetical protein
MLKLKVYIAKRIISAVKCKQVNGKKTYEK